MDGFTQTRFSYDKLKAELLTSMGRAECGEGGVDGPVHIVALPYPAQGHIVPMMEVCKKLAQEGFMVTFVNTEHNHKRLVESMRKGDGAGHGDGEKLKGGSWKGKDVLEMTGEGGEVPDADGDGESKRDKEGSGEERGVPKADDDSEKDVLMVNEGVGIRLAWVTGGVAPELHGCPDALIAAFQASEAQRSPFMELLHRLAEGASPVSCILSDVMMSWSQHCADAIGVPRLAFWTSSAAVFHVIHHMFHLISHGFPTFKDVMQQHEQNKISSAAAAAGGRIKKHPTSGGAGRNDRTKQRERGEDGHYGVDDGIAAQDAAPVTTTNEEDYSDAYGPDFDDGVDGEDYGPDFNGEEEGDGEEGAAHVVACIPGLPPMDLNDLPIIMRSEPQDFIYQFLVRQLTLMPRAAALLLNTFTALEPACVARLQKGMGGVPVLPIGPLLPRWVLGAVPRLHSDAAAGIFRQDASCLEWLESQPPKSVLYISFGSIFRMESSQFVELAEGLRSSGQAFLWSVRPDFISDSGGAPQLFDRYAADCGLRGVFTPWAPQLQVLSHPSVAAFLTHCGWNSTLESVALGVPMLCWPDIGERRTNGRMAVSLWRTALDFRRRRASSLVSRHEVERVVRQVMDKTSGPLRSRAADLQRAAAESWLPGGSSYNAWQPLLRGLHSLAAAASKASP